MWRGPPLGVRGTGCDSFRWSTFRNSLGLGTACYILLALSYISVFVTFTLIWVKQSRKATKTGETRNSGLVEAKAYTEH